MTKRTVLKYCVLATKCGSHRDTVSKPETMHTLELYKLIHVMKAGFLFSEKQVKIRKGRRQRIGCMVLD